VAAALPHPRALAAAAEPIAPTRRAAEGGAATEPAWVRATLIALAVGFLALFVVVPLVFVFAQALSRGVSAAFEAVTRPDTLSAIGLTLLTSAIVVPVNTIFGIATAWLLAKFEFRGKVFIAAVIDLPFSVSPVIAGLLFVLAFGRRGWFGPWLSEHDIRIIFAVPGIVLATTFVTFPFVVREVLPVMLALGNDEEESALTLGAGPWTMFFRVTLPKIKWGLLYGIVLTNARAMGEFGAVSVVSGHIRGETNTLPLQAEILFNGYDTAAAFAVASLLTLLALATLVLKRLALPRAGEEHAR
jgi:sulfate transport system permease protein